MIKKGKTFKEEDKQTTPGTIKMTTEVLEVIHRDID